MQLSCIFIVPCPEVVTAPENITVKPRENSSFDCVAWSHGSLYYYWYIEYTNGTISYYDPYQRCDTECDSYPIIHKQEFSLTSYTTEVHTFKVFNADEQSNEGWYCCVAVNECGNTTRCGWLEVDSKFIYLVETSCYIQFQLLLRFVSIHQILQLEQIATGNAR